MRIKKNDEVVILSGKERGLRGRVLRVLPQENKVIIEGKNIVYRHLKPGVTSQEGGIVQREAAIHASNVALYSASLDRGVRVRTRFVGHNGELYATKQAAAASFPEKDGAPGKIRKVRYAPKTGEIFD